MQKPTNAHASFSGDDRRKGKPAPPLFAELLLEAQWSPAEGRAVEGDGWFRAHGHAPDRRRGETQP